MPDDAADSILRGKDAFIEALGGQEIPITPLSFYEHRQEIGWLRDRLVEALGILREHQDVHGHANDHPTDEATPWRVRRDQFITKVEVHHPRVP